MFERVGQYLVEMHTGQYFPQNKNYPDQTVMEFLGLLESKDMRLFNQEVNVVVKDAQYCCTEFSFIQKHWMDWDDKKELFEQPQ